MPFLTDSFYVNFYGGEPLLCFDLIRHTISFLNGKQRDFKKTAQYSLTTNGSLITDDIIRFLAKHRFSVVFSFDGFAQDIQRKKGNFNDTVSKIGKILGYREIRLEINSVFTPETVDYLSDSVAFLIDLGVKDITLSLSLLRPWNQRALDRLQNEYARLRKICSSHYRKSREIPVKNFRQDKTEGYFYCAGAQDRMAVTSEEHVWGCDLFADYFRGREKSPGYNDFFFGDLDTFAQNHKKIYPKISPHYADLAMDNFATPHRECLFCSNLEECSVCPVVAALSGAALGRIPAYICAVQKIKIGARQKFRKEIR